MAFSTWYSIHNSCVRTSVSKFSTSSSQSVQSSVTNDLISVKQQPWLANDFGVHSLAKVFPPILYYSTQGEWVIKTTPTYLLPLLTFLKRHTATYYRQLRDITAIDHPKRKFRFEILYQLLSITYNQRLTVSVFVAEGTALNSATSLFSSAGWYERETWDRFGVFFRNHPDLRRRLTDYGFKGHPLRKDFPVTGFVEVRYNDFRKRILYEKVSLPQEYRIFTLNNSWAL